MFHYIGFFQYIGIPVPDLVCARGTSPASDEVPAWDLDTGAVNVEGGSRHSPQKEATPRTAEPTAEEGTTFTR